MHLGPYVYSGTGRWGEVRLKFTLSDRRSGRTSDTTAQNFNMVKVDLVAVDTHGRDRTDSGDVGFLTYLSQVQALHVLFRLNSSAKCLDGLHLHTDLCS